MDLIDISKYINNWIMKKFLILALLAFCQLVGAQNLYVYNVIGKASWLVGTAWKPLTKRTALKQTDKVRVEANSSLSIIDKQNNKVYAFKQTQGAQVVGALVQQVSGNSSSLSSKFFSHAVASLFGGSSDKVSHNAAGCTYRGVSVEGDIARTLVYKEKNSSLVQINNAQTDYSVTFDLIDPALDSAISSPVYIGREVFFRIHNNSKKDLYVNIIDVDDDGKLSDCLPVDDGLTMSHLLIPAESVIDLSNYPVTFVAPQGTDHLILVAYDEPFDVRVVNSTLLTPGLKPVSSTVVGLYNRMVEVR